ncbi:MULTISPECIES: sensor histidine kinase N-terminal domain-containing protein [unclassified Janthinobacterium]|uniref:sensor histidine kinase N-terminal domain-containing protein n=1 Tax=unclassified Janthinobacterium TaxID=2610881 RepID=UPI0018352D50|nr:MULTISPECIES: sensor histidine kinase N-terminal domain-containing protein [unclassified Janthinobacterium]MBB5368157.1 two-component system sensor histidine kinase TctE [Janthinobacterium sp. K2C7]MBB5379365.1 two-component system sensor histidine kinase TctE [Janthinobacterium sp. K2Li3]MBB5386539.1 two-component system sensor histidine kinase TctE [Janthinobacterium sp. K2E3]
MKPREAPNDEAAQDDWFEPPASEQDDTIQHSLFGEILDWMLAPLLLLWPMSIAITYLVAKGIANQPFDHALEDSVTMLTQQVKQPGGQYAAQQPERTGRTARDFLRGDDIDSVYYLIVGQDGSYVAGDRDLPPPLDPERYRSGVVLFRNDTIHGTPVRVAFSYLDMPASLNGEEPRRALVQVAETLEKRAQLANEIIKGVILPQFIILPIVLALVWFALARGLSPLAQLQERIRARPPDDLSPIETGQVPEEITPLVGSLNDMLARLSLSIDMQKRFIADAAHQMKTPLAGMRMQSELALRQTDHDEIHRSLMQLAKSSESATRLVNQLLALARAENQPQAGTAFEPIELSELARGVVHDWVQTSFAQQIDLGFEQPSYPIMISGNAMMLRELLGNLIDNALRYTPSGGSVTVRVRGTAELAILEVEDTGPGIPQAERPHVFERFYRILGSNADGSGLGLAIVREIAQQHGAEVDIFNNPRAQSPKLPGTLFRLSIALLLPDAPEPDDDINYG